MKKRMNPYFKLADFTPNQRSSIATEVVLYVENGKSANFNFAIDTGSYSTILSKELAELMFGDNIKYIDKKTTNNTSQKVIADVATVKKITVSKFTRQNFEIYVQDFQNDVTVDGILGRSFFQNNLKLHFDFIDGEVTLEN